MAWMFYFIRAALLAQLALTAPAGADVESSAACSSQQHTPPQATCSSLLQSSQNRSSKAALEVKEKPGLPRYVQAANTSQVSKASVMKKTKFMMTRIGLSLLTLFRKVEPDEGGSSWLIFLITAVLLVVLLGGGFWLYMQVRDKRRERQDTRMMATGNTSFMQGMSPAASLLPSARAVPAAPRPAQSMRPSAVPPVAKREPEPSIQPGQHFLCPGLVVPDATECTLVVPRILDQKGQKMLQVSIDDSRGVAVFRMELYPRPNQDGSRLVLLSPNGDTVFACCKDISDASRYGYPESKPALGIYAKDSSQPFGLLVNKQGNFEVTTLTKQNIRFQGRSSGSLNAVDEEDKLLALSDPAPDGPRGSPRRTVRIGPLVDAGLMTICYLGMDVMQSSTPSFSGSMF